jgi:hypothetical protein
MLENLFRSALDLLLGESAKAQATRALLRQFVELQDDDAETQEGTFPRRRDYSTASKPG